MKHIAVLGSTGSIGGSTLSVVESHPDRFRIVALAAGRNIDALRSQISRHQPAVVAVAHSEDVRTLEQEFVGIRFVAGAKGLEEAACHDEVETVVCGLAGSSGLAPTVAAIRAGKDIALANKETLVMAGELVMAEAKGAGVNLVPVDSEHAAIHQVLGRSSRGGVARLVLTASGGPFRAWPMHRIAQASVADALDHPTWKMGPKTTIDSATMMNKGLEIIEAHHLFAVPEEKIAVIVHPESLVHSMVEFSDGTTIAQLAPNDMRYPIFYALSWPDRHASRMDGLDLTTAPPLTFETPDEGRFPALGLARQALRDGGEMPAVLNAANEVAVASFLDGRCALPSITASVQATLDRWSDRNAPLTGIEQVRAVDLDARKIAREEVRKYHGAGMGSEIRC